MDYTPGEETERGPQSVDAREAFALLGHEIRLDILLALLEDWVAAYTEPKSYAELMAAVGVEDSGKFNYHLDQLRGVYVREVEDGYVPTAGATAVYRQILAHQPTEQFDLAEEQVDRDCPACGASAALRYERGFVTVDCPDCEDWAGFTYPFPKNGVESHGTDELLARVHERVRHDVALLRAGQCPDCAGAVATDLRPDSVGDGDDHWIELSCETCSLVLGLGVVSAVASEPQVATALRAVGIDPTGQDLDASATVSVVSTDPPVVAATATGPGGAVTVTVDDDLAVRSVDTDEETS